MDAEPQAGTGVAAAAWTSLAVAVPGLAHLERHPPLPCQDAAGAFVQPRPALVVADGAGSSPASDLGARAAVIATRRLLATLDGQLSPLLDASPPPAEDELRHVALLLVKHAKGVLEDLAVEHHRPVRDVRCTLLVVVVGQARLLWLKVGDGALVVEEAEERQAPGDEAPELAPRLLVLGEPGRGEFANQTRFVDEWLELDHVQSGTLSVERLTGLAAMTDGAAEKLVAYDGRQVSGQLSLWLAQLRQGALRQRDLVRRLYDEAFCRGTSGDDRSLALLARELDRSER